MNTALLKIPSIPYFRHTSEKCNPVIRYMPPEIKILFPHVQLPEHKSYVKETKFYPMDSVFEYVKYLNTEPLVSKDSEESHIPTKEEIHEQKMEENKKKNEELLKLYKPNENPKATKDSYRTLIVANLAYDIDDEILKKEFRRYGHLSYASVIRDKEGKSRGYGFVEFESKHDFKKAFDGMNLVELHGRRIIVDVERARTSVNWIPRRLGGGRGHTRYSRASLHRSKMAKKRTHKAELYRKRMQELHLKKQEEARNRASRRPDSYRDRNDDYRGRPDSYRDRNDDYRRRR